MTMSSAPSMNSSIPSCPRRDRRFHPNNPDRFRFLATYIAGRSVEVTEAPAGQPAHTNGQFIFVSAGGSVEEQRREMLVQAALLGAGSLDPRLVKGLRARATLARRYLALEGHRVLAELARQIPLDAALLADGQPSTATADESLEVAKSRAKVADPPEWFGVIKPSRLMAAPAGPGGQATNKDLKLQFDPIDMPESEDDDEDEDEDGGKSGESKILKLFRESALQQPVDVGLLPQDVRRFTFPRRGCRGRRDDSSLHPAGAGDRTECPSPAHPDPIHR